MAGHMAQFVAPAQGATWCGSPGMPCFNCSTHALDTPTAETCASRLMTSRLVAAMTHLTRLVEAEWPTSKDVFQAFRTGRIVHNVKVLFYDQKSAN